MDEHPDFVPLVLAAGQGRRLGGNKALLDLGGTPALIRLLEAAAAAGLGPPIVVLGHDAARVRPLLDGLSATPIVNPDPERGQTSSVQVGLTAVPAAASAVLVWPVDHALVTAEDVAGITAAARQHPEAVVVLPSHGGRAGHPALLRRDLFAAILDLPSEEPLHIIVRGERARTHFVECTSDRVIRDLDHPADLEEARLNLRVPPSKVP
jgi:CTP:molybdopterin cytidylyltransferase MocA